MRDLPPSFAALFKHPAPGLVFEAHGHAGLPERAYDAPHRLASAPSSEHLAQLHALAKGAGSMMTGLIDFYRQHDGAELFLRPDVLNGGEAPALALLPLELWDEATQPYLDDGDSAFLLEGFDLYPGARWRVIAGSPSEGTCLTLLFDGEYQGEALAGRIYYVSMDPVHSMVEPVANDFAGLLERIGTDPAKFLNDIGWTGIAEVDGQMWGDPCSGYVEDVRKHPSYVPGK